MAWHANKLWLHFIRQARGDFHPRRVIKSRCMLRAKRFTLWVVHMKQNIYYALVVHYIKCRRRILFFFERHVDCKARSSSCSSTVVRNVIALKLKRCTVVVAPSRSGSSLGRAVCLSREMFFSPCQRWTLRKNNFLGGGGGNMSFTLYHGA